MGLEDQLNGPSRRLLQFTGRPVTLVNTEVDETAPDDEYGDRLPTETRVETTAEFEFPGSPEFQQRVGGVEDTDIDVLIFVPSDVGEDAYPDAPGGPPPAVFSGDESATRNPTEILDQRSGRTYEVGAYVDEHNGRARLHGVR